MARQALLNSMLSPLPSTARRRSMLNCFTIVAKRVSTLCESNQRWSKCASFFVGRRFLAQKILRQHPSIVGRHDLRPDDRHRSALVVFAHAFTCARAAN